MNAAQTNTTNGSESSHTVSGGEQGRETLHDLFQDAFVVSVYTRSQAIEDGVLVDVTETAREAGFKYPVAVTRAVWLDCVEWTEETAKRKAAYQDESGRLWDVVYMASLAAKAKGDGGSRRNFGLYRVPVEGRGKRARYVVLTLHIGSGDDGAPVLTISLPNED